MEESKKKYQESKKKGGGKGGDKGTVQRLDLSDSHEDSGRKAAAKRLLAALLVQSEGDGVGAERFYDPETETAPSDLRTNRLTPCDGGRRVHVAPQDYLFFWCDIVR